LDLDSFTKKTLLYGIDYFLYTLNSIIDEQIAIVKSELENSISRVDIELIEEITTLLNSLKGKKYKFKNALYGIIGIEANNLQKRKKLKALLDKIDTDLNILELDIEQNRALIGNLEELIAELKELKNRFINLSKKENIEKLDFYISEIDAKVKILDGFSYTLMLKSINLLKIKQIYISLQRIKNGAVI